MNVAMNCILICAWMVLALATAPQAHAASYVAGAVQYTVSGSYKDPASTIVRVRVLAVVAGEVTCCVQTNLDCFAGFAKEASQAGNALLNHDSPDHLLVQVSRYLFSMRAALACSSACSTTHAMRFWRFVKSFQTRKHPFGLRSA